MAEVMSSARAVVSNRWRMLAVIAVAQLMIILDGSIVNVALPHMAEELAHRSGQCSVGRDGLHPRVRLAAAARRAHRRLLGPQAHVRRRPPRLRRSLRARWPCAIGGPDVRRACAPGCIRGAPRARRSVARYRCVHRAQGARKGVRRVRCAVRSRCGHRPHPRWHPYRRARLALGDVGQRSFRDRDRDLRHRDRPRVQGCGAPAL